MIFCLLYVCLFGESIASGQMSPGGNDFSKSIMCYYSGNMGESNTELINLEPKNIPCECEVIIYGRFSINSVSKLDVDTGHLKSVTDLNKPVILQLTRNNRYSDWGYILGPNGNDKEAKILCDFASANKIAGFLVDNLVPACTNVPFDENVGTYIIPYLKQLKCSSDFIIGVGVDPYGSSIKNPCMYNFQQMNDLVTFYEIQTYFLNSCKPKLYNGGTPIPKMNHGSKYLYGMEEVVEFLKESKICLAKTTFDIEIDPCDTNSELYNSYSQVCKEHEFNSSSWCVQNTNMFFEKGKFVSKQNSGIIVKILDLDDVNNDCGCSKAFAGFYNIIAGYRGGSQISCQNFDVQSVTYPGQ